MKTAGKTKNHSGIAFEDVMKKLSSKARPDQLEGMARFGICGDGRLGVAVPELRKMAKEIGIDHSLALRLWATGIPDAMILAPMVDDPVKVTESQADKWVRGLDSWDVCDGLCMNLLDKTSFAAKKIKEWSVREEEFVKRAAYTLIACVAWHDKNLPDEFFVKLFPIIKNGSTDNRNFVKKAVNWALRNMGKRNLKLNSAAIKAAREIHKLDFSSARWIAADAIRELESPAVRRRLNTKRRDGQNRRPGQ
jgi:3-methyladenine DNA glycosylase AlkD